MFFSHWRHHVDAVNGCLENADKHKTFDFLLTAIRNIKNDSIEKGEFNPTGSLARRIRYIEQLHEQAIENEMKKKEITREKDYLFY